ncbi:MAG: hypothetical protein OXU63_11535 [Acidobacteriota bacterium]|nr:hypothetical protein [Acidobacteriota bacterium]
MRLHIALADDLVAELDRRAGPRQRSAFIAELIQRGLDGISDTGHDWDDDPAEWVRRQRRGDRRRSG